MKVTFWGTRGSLPAPGPNTIRYGGNTTCVEVQLDSEELIILDCGSGLRELGLHLERSRGRVRASILLTHFHWDHIQGFPFFIPAYVQGNQFLIAGPDDVDQDLEMVLGGQMASPYFPVDLHTMSAEIKFMHLSASSYPVGTATVSSVYVNHPGLTLGYRITEGHTNLVFIPDNEPFQMPAGALSDPAGAGDLDIRELFDQYVEDKDRGFIDFCQDADLLIHDAMYTEAEYPARVGWGHSSYLHALSLALRSGVKQLALHHHSPERSDEEVEAIVARCGELIKQEGASLECFAAREGMVIQL